MKKIVIAIIFIFILIFIIFSLAKCTYNLHSIINADVPEYATAEFLSEQYAVLINEVDAIIEASMSKSTLIEDLKVVKYPDNIALVTLIEQDEISINKSNVLIEKNIVGGARINITVEGFGYGSVGEQDVVIIKRPVSKYDIEELELLLKYNRKI